MEVIQSMTNPKTLEVEGPTVLGISTLKRHNTLLGVAPQGRYEPDRTPEAGGRYRFVRKDMNDGASKSGIRARKEVLKSEED